MVKTSTELGLLIVCGVSSSGTSAVGLAGVISPTNTLSETTLIPLGLFLAGLAMTTTVVWKVASHNAKTDAKMTDLIRRIEQLEEAAKSNNSRRR